VWTQYPDCIAVTSSHLPGRLLQLATPTVDIITMFPLSALERRADDMVETSHGKTVPLQKHRDFNGSYCRNTRAAEEH
jgi:hypothetical protein